MPNHDASRAEAGSARTPWHSLSPEDALAQLGTSLDGLSSEEVSRRLETYGPNLLPRAKGDSALVIFWRQINNPLIYVLLAAAAFAFFLGKTIDGSVVAAVVLINAIVGLIQEYRAGKAIESLSAMVPKSATVMRGGERLTIPAADLVPGDVVLLASGDQVPADLRLVQIKSLQIEEAALTGESVPSEKNLVTLAPDTSLGDRKNLGFGGSMVTYGTGTGVVTGTGRNTELGRISAMLTETTALETPLIQQMGVVGKWLTIWIVLVSGILFGIGIFRGYTMIDATLAAISLAVAAIPEGLPSIITIALSIGVKRMAARRAIIRKLPAVETLGSTTVICSDKTGTLTRNEMTVQALWTPDGRSFQVSGVGYAPEGQVTENGQALESLPPTLWELVEAGALCNDATIKKDEQGHWVLSGDPTEGAMVTLAAKVGLDPDKARLTRPRMDAIPFESERQYMATLHPEGEDDYELIAKGAPEAILKRCDSASGGGVLDHNAVHEAVNQLAAQGMRVLAFAAKHHADHPGEVQEDHAESGFVFLGLQGMIDPPRAEAIASVAACKKAGITVKMITGDHAGTAAAIGGQLGLLDQGQKAVTGKELEITSDADLRQVAESTNVFARVAPEHKLRLVKALQANGHVVAMTGDGVNDAPALKQANIGTAMGITGTAVSKEAADIVLTDDNFASIAAAVEEGRRVYDNLVKSLAFVLPTNMAQGFIILWAVLFFPLVKVIEEGVEKVAPLMPILPVQILWVNLVVTVALALPLAFEAKEPNVMVRPPRDPRKPILDLFILQRSVITAVLMTIGSIVLFHYEYGHEIAKGTAAPLAEAEAQTAAILTLILCQMFYMLQCRSLNKSVMAIGLFSNLWVYVGLGSILILQVGFTYLPFMNQLFGTMPIGVEEWIRAFLMALIVFPVITLEKWWRRRSEVAA
jgi:magnesium-transporting ATPase (P-type)